MCSTTRKSILGPSDPEWTQSALPASERA